MIYDLIIIGGGPAGITAGIYATRQELNTLLITKNFGGQMTKKAVDIENYPGFEKISGLELIQKFEKHLRGQKINIEKDLVVSVQKSDNVFSVFTKDKKNFKAKAVIIASGAEPKTLGIPGEEEYIGRGVSFCALCDGPMFANKEVAVIGGGNTAFETAIFLSNYVKKIYILEYDFNLKALESLQEMVRKIGKAEIITSVAVKEIQGDKFVKSIIYQNRKAKEQKTLSVEGVFVEIGYQPETSFVKDLIAINKKDEILVDFQTNQTKTLGLFAAGDVGNVPYKQIVIAAGEGAKAALSAYEYLQEIKYKQ